MPAFHFGSFAGATLDYLLRREAVYVLLLGAAAVIVWRTITMVREETKKARELTAFRAWLEEQDRALQSDGNEAA